MNLSPEAFEQVLTELADRADTTDGRQVADRVPAVRARARRTARRRAGALATVLTVLVVLASGVTRLGGLPSLRGEGTGPAKKPAATAPYLTVRLVRDEKAEAAEKPMFPGGRVVVVDVILHGRVPRWTGYRAGAPVTDNLWERILYADHGDSTSTSTLRSPQVGFRCDPGAPLVDMDTTFTMDIQYETDSITKMIGPHDLRFATGACVPVGLVQAFLTVDVK